MQSEPRRRDLRVVVSRDVARDCTVLGSDGTIEMVRIPPEGEGMPDVGRLLGLRRVQAQRALCGAAQPSDEHWALIERTAIKQVKEEDLKDRPDAWSAYRNAAGGERERERLRLQERGKTNRRGRRSDGRWHAKQMSEARRARTASLEALNRQLDESTPEG